MFERAGRRGFAKTSIRSYQMTVIIFFEFRLLPDLSHERDVGIVKMLAIDKDYLLSCEFLGEKNGQIALYR